MFITFVINGISTKSFGKQWFEGLPEEEEQAEKKQRICNKLDEHEGSLGC